MLATPTAASQHGAIPQSRSLRTRTPAVSTVVCDCPRGATSESAHCKPAYFALTSSRPSHMPPLAYGPAALCQMRWS
eukprot:497029-Prymnesium_polylepis.2